MPDLYLTDLVATRTKRRAYAITIDNPQAADKHVAYHQEDVQVTADDTRVSAIKAGTMTVPFGTVAVQVRTVHDPVTGQDVTMSGAAVAAWIEADYVERATAAL